MPEVYADLLTLFGVNDPDSATDGAKQRLLNDINAAVQTVAGSGEDFYGREEIEVNLTEGTAAYELPKTVMRVLDPVRLEDGTVLRKLTSRSMFINYGTLFLGQMTNAVANGRPAAYFIESLKDTHATDGAEDSVKIKLHVVPAPSAAQVSNDALLDVVKEPTLFVLADLEDDAKKVPIPHKYAQAIFLPIARWNASGSEYFVHRDNATMMTRFNEDYERAMNLLEVADPRRPKPADSNNAAARLPQAAPAGAGGNR